MNCANHPDRERVAFCQNCGKPLCTDCVRNVGSQVFCEPCLTARVAGTAPPHTAYGYAPPPGYAPGYTPGYPPAGQPHVPGEPSPGLAALLGFIPGVGAMYNEQYAKGIVHLMVFAVLVSLASDVNDIFGLFVCGWMAYMVIEAHHTAKARRDGTPLPNPFGLNDLSERLGFGKAWPQGVPPADSTAPNPNVAPNPNAPPANPYTPPASAYAPPYSYSYVPPVTQWAAAPDASTYGMPPTPPVPPVPPMPGSSDPNLPYYQRFPSAAVWLIGLGVLFLLSNIPVFHLFRGRLFVPIFFIGIGVWLFVRRMLDTGPGFENDGTAYYHWRLQRALRGSVWMVLIGVLWLLSALHILAFGHSWPLLLIAVGVMLFFKRTFAYGYGYGAPPPVAMATPPAAPVTTTELASTGPTHEQDHTGDGEEGR